MTHLVRQRARLCVYLIAIVVAIVWRSNAVTTAANDIVIYANDVPDSSVFGGWSKVSDATAAGGVKLATADNAAATVDPPIASPTSYFDVSFQAPANTPYTVWLRLQATANSKYNDSLWVQFSNALVNGTSIYALNTTSALLVNLATDSSATSVNGWGWQNTAYWLTQPTTLTFATSGTHTIRLQVREDGRSEERRVGKECRSRWKPQQEHEKQAVGTTGIEQKRRSARG